MVIVLVLGVYDPVRTLSKTKLQTGLFGVNPGLWSQNPALCTPDWWTVSLERSVIITTKNYGQSCKNATQVNEQCTGIILFHLHNNNNTFLVHASCRLCRSSAPPPLAFFFPRMSAGFPKSESATLLWLWGDYHSWPPQSIIVTSLLHWFFASAHWSIHLSLGLSLQYMCIKDCVCVCVCMHQISLLGPLHWHD